MLEAAATEASVPALCKAVLLTGAPCCAPPPAEALPAAEHARALAAQGGRNQVLVRCPVPAGEEAPAESAMQWVFTTLANHVTSVRTGYTAGQMEICEHAQQVGVVRVRGMGVGETL